MQFLWTTACRERQSIDGFFLGQVHQLMVRLCKVQSTEETATSRHSISEGMIERCPTKSCSFYCACPHIWSSWSWSSPGDSPESLWNREIIVIPIIFLLQKSCCPNFEHFLWCLHSTSPSHPPPPKALLQIIICGTFVLLSATYRALATLFPFYARLAGKSVRNAIKSRGIDDQWWNTDRQTESDLAKNHLPPRSSPSKSVRSFLVLWANI